MVVLSTAHPAKFPAAVEAACGRAPARRPSGSPICRASPNVNTVLADDQTAVEHFISSVSRARAKGSGMTSKSPVSPTA